MAVLKSFELKGNKLSFANWISNLSPTETPFTSMIGKEKIDQTQYSWQTDSLAPATAEAFEEGSQAESQPRASTQVFTNFTTILRRAASVSDTNSATHAYGRRDEMAYQLGKAGTALMRDIEYMNLARKTGNIGTATKASRHTGFKRLCAPMYFPDPDTKAVTHKGVMIVDPTKPWFTMKDLFDVTINLFVVGSKANKIMFHPRHMAIFSDQLGYNEEEPLVHRMFDGLDPKMNLQVAQIKDPVGRLYTLIPNRFMPDNQVYIFHEDDWTQMVLREPQRTKIARKGSRREIMIEAEVGLRHRHPYASGVLHMVSVDYITTLAIDNPVLNTIPGNRANFTLNLTDTTGTASSQDFKVAVSDSSMVELETLAGQTDAGGRASFWVSGRKPGTVVVYVYRDDVDKRMLSNPITLEVKAPELEIEVDKNYMGMGQRISATTTVINPSDGSPAPLGSKVVWKTNSPQIIFVDDATGTFLPPNPVVPTDPTGESKVKIAAQYPGSYRVWTEYDGAKSKRVEIQVGPADLKFNWGATKNTYTVGEDNAVDIEVEIKDRDGNLIPDGAEVQWAVGDPSVGKVQLSQSVSVGGIVKNTFKALDQGHSFIQIHAYGDVNRFQFTSRYYDVSTLLNPSNTMVVGERGTALESFITDSEGNPITGKVVHWVVEPTSLLELDSVQGTTDSGGIAETTVNPLGKGTGTITTFIDGRALGKTEFFIGTGAKALMRVNPSTIQLGDEVDITLELTGDDGVGLSDRLVTFTSSPFIGDLSGLDANTTATGTYEDKFTPLVDQDFELQASIDGFDLTAYANVYFTERKYTYETTDSMNVTIGVGQSHNVTFAVKDDKGQPVVGQKIEFSVNDTSKATVEGLNQSLTNAQGECTVSVTPVSKGRVSLTVKAEGKVNPHSVDLAIKDPSVVLAISPSFIKPGRSTTVSGRVLDANGNPLNAQEVDFVTNPVAGGNIPTATTDSNGNFSLTWTPGGADNFEVFAFLKNYDSVQSEIQNLIFDDVVYEHVFTGHTTPVTAYIGRKIDVTTNVREGGAAATGVVVEFINDTPDLINVAHKSGTTTDAWGNHVLEIEALKHGTGVVRVRGVGHKEYETFEVDLREPLLTLTLNPNPRPNSGNVVFTMNVKDHNWVAVSGIGGTIISDPMPDNRNMIGTTNSTGDMKFTRSIADGYVREVYGYLTNYPDVRTINYTLTVQ